MPNYKKHLIGGLGAYAALLIILQRIIQPVSLLSAGEWLVCSLAGSLFPDIDIKSRGQKYFYRVILLVMIFLIIQRQFSLLATSSVMAVTPMLVRHRGIFHRLWFVILFPLAIWYIVSLSVPTISTILLFDILFFIAGAISHLWLDFGFWRMLRFR
ncbi:MAG TPA: hypothetical protein ENI08_03115 [Candidatus Dependentiae bacterium]|nr:hypothetical protein [Candidatus Dependentiae bacterium]